MQAVIFERAGRPEEVLAVREMPEPVPGRGQVLIRVEARAIQPADFLFIEGRYRAKPAFPQVAGLEGSGRVLACGEGAEGFPAGTRVAFRSTGAWAELALAPLSRVYPVPPEIPEVLACQFALNPLTAWGLLADCSPAPSSRLLITAGRSAVARLLARLAARRGIRAFLLVREGAGYNVLEGEGGSLLARGESVAEALGGVAQAGPFHAILDPVGGPDTLALMDALAPGGRLVTYGLLDDRELSLKSSRLLFKNMTWQGFGVDGWLDRAAPAQIEVARSELWAMLAEEPGLLPVAAAFPLSRVDEAIRAVRETHLPGKVLLTG